MSKELQDRVELLATRRDGDLALARARLSEPNAKWRVVSGLQKAIRRGDVDQAHLMTSALLNSGESDYIYRRLCVVALEDIAFGDVDLCADVFAFCGYKSVRNDLPHDMLLHLVRSMALTSGHDRSPNELNTVATYGPNTAETKLNVISKLPEQNLEIAKSDASFSMRLMALQSLGGVLHNGAAPKKRQYGERNGKMWYSIMSELPEPLTFIAGKAMSFGGELTGLASAMKIVWDAHGKKLPDLVQECDQPKPDGPLINGIASIAYDMHTHEGKRAIGYFAKACKPVAAMLESLDIEKANGLLGDIIFEVEGKWCVNRRFSNLGVGWEHRSHLAEAETWGVQPEDFFALKDLVLVNLDALNHARQRVTQ